ncbi:MAG: ParB N-terminal domain-containing protein, partial [Nitrospinae bacterium]|nr:ParB N-terminal domain-containing protein [Nitrospinota bacterium]
IQEIGLLNPITVIPFRTFDASNGDEQFQLIAGHHRLEACRQVGMTEIEARVVTAHEVDQRLAEIDENLCRAELSQLERAEHLKERKNLYEMKHPETRHGGTPGQAGGGKKAKDANLASFAQDASCRTGESKRNIHRAVRRADKIDPEVRDQIRDIDAIANNASELDALASMGAKEQKAAVRSVVEGKAHSVREAAGLKSKASPSSRTRAAASSKAPASQRSSKADEWQKRAAEAEERLHDQDITIAALKEELAALQEQIRTRGSQPQVMNGSLLRKMLDQLADDLSRDPVELPADILRGMHDQLLTTVAVIERAMTRLSLQTT